MNLFINCCFLAIIDLKSVLPQISSLKSEINCVFGFLLLKHTSHHPQNGCKDRMVNWLSKHRLQWLAPFGGLLLFQFFTVLLAVSAINHLKSRSSSMESLDDLHTTTYMWTAALCNTAHCQNNKHLKKYIMIEWKA